jgi:AraC-like DNA-binding protein
MQAFYKQALLRLVLLLGVSLLVGDLCFERSHHREDLLGHPDMPFQLRSWNNSGGGSTDLRAKADASRVVMEFTLSGKAPYTYASTSLFFTDAKGKPRLLDWSRFDKISLEARCFPANTLRIGISTFDRKVTKADELLTYRSPSAYIDCTPDGAPIELDLKHLTVQQWWLELFKINPADAGYSLDKVAQLEIGTSNRSRADVPSHVEIARIRLHNREPGYLYFFALFVLSGWSAYAFWFFRRYTAALSNDLHARMRRDLPLVAYQQLAIEPHREKEKSSLLKMLATRYADPELDLETVVAETGVNRNKVNEILKAQMGYTFTGYLNKLRLTEASRLLVENATASIAEIAYSVGYKNSSYFNKLFKEEYDCTPKAFRELCMKKAGQPPPD